MKLIKIKGNKEAIYNCLDCGKKLSYGEYIGAKDRCSSCKTRYYDGQAKYRNMIGENDIDSILINRRKVR